MYDFTVDPGYKEWLVTINLTTTNNNNNNNQAFESQESWGDYQSYVNKLKSVLAYYFFFFLQFMLSFRTRYFSESRKGHQFEGTLFKK
jgi:hypothetical protein